MQSAASTPDEYIAELPDDRQACIQQLRSVIIDHLPQGFHECMNYGMIAYVVPHDLYPDGYHCDPALPLPFMNIASQKRHIALYHMGLYADPDLLSWWESAYADQAPTKLNMGKSCVRWTKPAHIPYALVGELVTKMSVKDWITLYERAVKS